MRTLRSGLLAVLGLLLLGSGSSAQTTPVDTTPPTKQSWKFGPRLELGTEYDNNIFLLPVNKRDDPGAPSAAELISGRYLGMESASDLITTARAAVSFDGPGMRGRDLTITPTIAYEWYSRNVDRSNVALGLAIEQALRRDGRLRVRTQFQPGYFARNYLADAIDGNVDGTITADERRYERGEYAGIEVLADYRHRLAKSSKQRPFGAWLILGAGFEDRSYEAPFAARGYSGPTAAARVQFDLAHGVTLVTSYDLALLGSPVSAQVILLDEPVFGVDLNGNANATDLNARTVQTVDRSRTEQAISQAARFELTKNTDLEVAIDYRWRAFSSSEPYDVANNGRRDHRLQYSADFSHRFAKRIRGFVGGTYGGQGLNRRTDLGGNGAVDDYTKLQAHAGLRLSR